MRLGIKTHLYNYVMRDARQELGWTQQQLAEECGWTHPGHIMEIEGMKMPKGKPKAVREKLQKISNALCIPFNELFPQEYLDAIQNEKLPRRKTPYEWCVEVPLEPLLTGLEFKDPLLIDTPSLDQKLIMDEFSNQLRQQLSTLSQQEQDIINKRFGLNTEEIQTFEEIATYYNVSRGRIQQIQEMALSKLRHPLRSRKLREYAPNG